MSKEIYNEQGESNEPIIELNNKYYNCTECSSSIEILSINEKEGIIEFKCMNNNHRKKLPIKEYINKMKKYHNKNLNNDICHYNNHNKKYKFYCLNCKIHLCNECLKSRNHLSHHKNIIMEIQPNKKELNIIENIIKHYEVKIDILEKEKIIRTK